MSETTKRDPRITLTRCQFSMCETKIVCRILEWEWLLNLSLCPRGLFYGGMVRFLIIFIFLNFILLIFIFLQLYVLNFNIYNA